MSARALVLAAPSSGSGKTAVTLALLAAFRAEGRRVAGAKVGPDYLDPQFLAAASGRPARNLDPWGMRPALVRALAAEAARENELLLIEGVMGLFDGAADGTGSTADLAALLGLPVLLLLDVRRQSHSVAALVKGFRDFRAEVEIAGLLLNRVAGARHELMLREALAPLGLPVLGALPDSPALAFAERHLGLVQAVEQRDLPARLAEAAALVRERVELAALAALTRPLPPAPRPQQELPPPGQRVAVARDEAFAFAYPHLLDGWRRQGAELSFFSPLADEAPGGEGEAVFLPGGYPELHAGRLAGAQRFLSGLRGKAAAGALIYGECGGYMVLGEGLVDGEGARHAMAGLLPLETSFAARRRHLGYRRVTARQAGFWGPAGTRLTGHEFHYATVEREGPGEAPFTASDARGEGEAPQGLAQGRVAGSFLHLLDLA